MIIKFFHFEFCFQEFAEELDSPFIKVKIKFKSNFFLFKLINQYKDWDKPETRTGSAGSSLCFIAKEDDLRDFQPEKVSLDNCVYNKDKLGKNRKLYKTIISKDFNFQFFACKFISL